MIYFIFGTLAIVFCNWHRVSASTQRVTIVVSEEDTPKFGPRILVNGTSPGPAIFACAGLPIEIRVINSMSAQVTAIHFHGIEQRNSPFSDGVINVTQCPIRNFAGDNANASELIYNFIPQVAGTFWYHGHTAEQYVDGLYGALIVQDLLEREQFRSHNAKYSIDSPKWVWVISDYYATKASNLVPNYIHQISEDAEIDEPIPDALIMNGKLSGQWAQFLSDDYKNHSYRVRVINAAALSMLTISIDGLPLKIIELDGVAIIPHDVKSITLNVGQRVSFVLDFNRLSKLIMYSPSIYLRITAVKNMYPSDLRSTVTNRTLSTQWRGTINFQSSDSISSMAPLATPTYSTIPFLPYSSPRDRNFLDARPLKAQLAPSATHYMIYNVSVRQGSNENWFYINGLSGYHNWSHGNHSSPLLYRFWENSPEVLLKTMRQQNKHRYLRHTPEKKKELALDNVNPYLKQIPGNGQEPFVVPAMAVVDVLIYNHDDGEHPIHMHGHRFFILATSAYPEAQDLYRYNYLMRDTVSVPAKGWAKIRFVADNPGVWLFHCHIDWHMAAGFVAVIIEAPEVLYQQRQRYTKSLPNDHLEKCFGASY